MDIQLFLILLTIATSIFLYIKYRPKIGQEFIVAFLIALAWASYYGYEYVDQAGYFIGSINLFPLILQTAGLVLLREVYEYIQTTRWRRFFYSVILWWIFLAITEAVGFHLLGIQVTPSYPSLFGIGILHVTLVAQIYYITFGPIYLLITDYLKVK